MEGLCKNFYDQVLLADVEVDLHQRNDIISNRWCIISFNNNMYNFFNNTFKKEIVGYFIHYRFRSQSIGGVFLFFLF